MNNFRFENGKWVIDGDLPKGIRFVNGEFRAQAGEAAPECFGLLWDGIGPRQSPECKVCDFFGVCCEKTSKATVPASQAILGEGQTLGDLSEDLGISEDSVQ